jgi:hypothetical protein
MPLTNLPFKADNDSAAATKAFFNTYGNLQLEFTANEVSASIGFFQSRGFDTDASIVTAQVLLRQAKIDGIPVFRLLDTLKTFNGVQISAIVAEILNNNRNATSVLGYKITSVEKQNQTRNIFA